MHGRCWTHWQASKQMGVVQTEGGPLESLNHMQIPTELADGLGSIGDIWGMFEHVGTRGI